PFRALERRHVGRRRSLLVHRGLAVGDIERAHGTPPISSGSTWHTEPAFSRPRFRNPANLRRACRAKPALFNWKQHRDRPNARRLGPKPPIEARVKNRSYRQVGVTAAALRAL